MAIDGTPSNSEHSVDRSVDRSDERLTHEPAEPQLGSGDPMASIRPAYPDSPPPLAPTIELDSDSPTRDPQLHASVYEITEQPHGVLSTQDSGPFVIPVREAGERSERDASDPAPGAPESGVAYELIERIGEGGMGEVWRARQQSLGRRVALKRLRKGRERLSSVVRQFESEARLTGALDHPNIVTVHELGRDQVGRVFYTMKLIDGTPWDQALSAYRRRTAAGDEVVLDLRDHLEILLEVAQAVAFAHSRGVIHRDIKPGNVMLGDYGEVLLVDWGLAVALSPLAELGEAKTWILADLPRSALVCGTPAYMSPETAKAQRERIGLATDVYLLGAVLFHVLYGRPLHEGRSVEEVITRAKANVWSFPEDIPRKLRPWHTLLRPVIVRALASEPSLRFHDAEAFATALRQALRNYDSAKQASRAQDKLALLERGELDVAVDYQSIAKMVASFEQALESWPGNLTAYHGLGRAQLLLARAALDNSDLNLARFGLRSFAERPPPPEPEPELQLARLTLHGSDQTLIGAPRLTDTLLAIASSRNWVSSALRISSADPLGGSSISGERAAASASSASASASASAPAISPAAATVDAFGLVEQRRCVRADGTGASARLERGQLSSLSVSLSIEGPYLDVRLADEQALSDWAQAMQSELGMRELREQRRRITYAGLRILAGVLALGLVLVGATGWRALMRAQVEGDRVAQVLIDELAGAIEADLLAGQAAEPRALTASSAALPRGVARGQVFVFDASARVLGLPREVPENDRAALLADPPRIQSLDQAPLSQAAHREWVERGRPEAVFRVELNARAGYWVGVRRLASAGDPGLWVGVVVPEDHFVPPG
ncbi:serine/threonine protein kinase [Pseudenhygromyxa sp. WMMC2535]|uniref:serine/threonine-protein kinase n=1 Tax=Pseudenhygromyxa sp. WMMC2535 TaxID=2712867 RepID=UPI0015527C67|nr:serine/threonine-protein kinase [Pseudenhygromyxa sp. WMMC2535]NVB39464.1 serine/threonine protein kinase [Pseudenhygromyxa sp. WMMC2535]